MKRVLWLWRVYDDVTKKRVITRHRMDEETARQTYPDAEKVEGSAMEITPSGNTGDFLRKH